MIMRRNTWLDTIQNITCQVHIHEIKKIKKKIIKVILIDVTILFMF